MTDAVLQTSVYAAVLYVAVAVFRRVLGDHAGPRLRLALWGLLMLRLLLPVTWESPVRPFSWTAPAVQSEKLSAVSQQNLSSAQTIGSEGEGLKSLYDIQSLRSSDARHEAAAGNAITSSLRDDITALPASGFVWPLDLQMSLLLVWITGIVTAAIVFAAQALRLRRRLRQSRHPDARLTLLLHRTQVELGLRRVPALLVTAEDSPALTASLRPRLLLPRWMTLQLGDGELAAALRHELTHYRRGDHLLALLLLVLRCVYWFHPAVWLMARHLREDMELACDAAVVKGLDLDQRRVYAQTLLALYGRGRPRLALPMAGSALRAAQLRLQRVFQPTSSAPAARFAALALSAVLVLGCFTTACQPKAAGAANVAPAATPLKAMNMSNAVTAPVAAASAQPVMPRPARYDGIPATWQDALRAQSLTMDVTIDAAITVPTVDKLPVMLVSQRQVSQAEVDGFLAAFGQGPYHFYNDDFIKTKADYAQNLKELQKNLAAVDGNREYTAKEKATFKKDYQDAILRAQRDMDNAPETVNDIVNPVFTDKYLIQRAAQPKYFGDQPPDTRINQQRAQDAKAFYGRMGLQEVRIQWTQDDEPRYLHAAHGNDWSFNYFNYETRRGRFSTRDTVDGTGDIQFMKTTWEQARAQAQQTIDALGLGHLTLARCGKLVDLPFGYRSRDKGEVFTDFATAPYIGRGYVFNFTCNVNGAHETYMANYLDVQEQEESPGYERLRVVIDDKGIRSVQHEGPVSVPGEALRADSQLLGFQKIQAIAREQFTQGKFSLGGEDLLNEHSSYLKGKLWIDRVELGYARVKQPNGRYALTPAWDFFGYWAMQYDDENQGPFNTYSAQGDKGRYSVLTIDAVNGTIIDREKGR